MVNITEVRMRCTEAGGRTRAIASLTFDECFVVHEVKLVEGRDREIFMSMPSRRLPGGDHLDIAHPVTSQTRQYIQEELMRVYETAVNEGRREYRTAMQRRAD